MLELCRVVTPSQCPFLRGQVISHHISQPVEHVTDPQSACDKCGRIKKPVSYYLLQTTGSLIQSIFIEHLLSARPSSGAGSTLGQVCPHATSAPVWRQPTACKQMRNKVSQILVSVRSTTKNKKTRNSTKRFSERAIAGASFSLGVGEGLSEGLELRPTLPGASFLEDW